MGYITYREQLEDKLHRLGIVKLKKRIVVDGGYFEEGTFLKPISVLSCNEAGTECCLLIATYCNDYYISSDVRFKNFKIEDWFESSDALNALDRMVSDAKKKYERTSNFAYSFSFIFMLIFGVISVIWCYVNGIVSETLSTPTDIITAILAVFGIAALMLLILVFVNDVGQGITDNLYEKKLKSLNQKIKKIISEDNMNMLWVISCHRRDIIVEAPCMDKETAHLIMSTEHPILSLFFPIAFRCLTPKKLNKASNCGAKFYGAGIPENCTEQERQIYGTPGCGKSFSVKDVKSNSD